MTQSERRVYLIRELLREQQKYTGIQIPAEASEQKRLLRSLFNLRLPKPVSAEFGRIQDDYLQTETARKGITDFTGLRPVEEGIYLWRGDITTLRCDAIVNAANSQLLGCFCPCHGCIDNQIHTFSGVQLRLFCAGLMRRQGRPEAPGGAKLTPGYNLPCNYILHTVGPVVDGEVTAEDERLLKSCYRASLELAAEAGIKSLAFCCISTGEFHFPNDRAAELAVQTVKAYQRSAPGKIEVIFNVFKELDYEIYRDLLDSSL